MPFDGHYDGWRDARLRFILSTVRLAGQRVLEVGCGYAHIGDRLAQEGASVTVSDARQEHLDWVREHRPHLTTVQADLDQPWPLGSGWDIIVHMGLLYHLADPEAHLRQVCSAGSTILLETEVINSPSDTASVRMEDEEGYDQAFNRTGTRLSTANIERILTECGRSFSRIDSSSLNHDFHTYDWSPVNEPEYRSGLRRFWIIN